MKPVRLGKTGLQVSRVGLGGIPIQRLTSQEYQAIEQNHDEVGTRFCRRLEYCEPCPYPLPIRDMLVEQFALVERALQ